MNRPIANSAHHVRAAVDAALRALQAAGDDSLEAAAGILAVHGRRLLDCECAVTVIQPGRPDRFVVIAAAGTWAETLVGSVYPVADTLHGRALTSRRPVVSSDVVAETPLPDVFRRGGITSGVLVPLPVGVALPDGRPGVGVISYWRGGLRPFDASEVAAARAFTSSAGAALTRVELLRAYRATTHRLAETVADLEADRMRLEQAHLRAMEALTAVSRFVDAGGSMADFFGQMSSTVAGLVDAERVVFARLTPRGALHPVLHAHGVDDATLRGLGEPRIRPDGTRGIERVVNLGTTVRLRLEDIPEGDVAAPAVLRALAQRDFVITRWSAGDRVLGVLAAYDCKRAGGFTGGDAQVMEICARATGLVWEQVRSRRRARTAEARRIAQEVEHAERMRSIVGSALDAIITMDVDGRILEVNRAAEELFGYQRSVAVGKRLAELLIPPELRERHLTSMRRHLANDGATMVFRRLDAPALRADGTTFDAEIAVVRTTWEGRPVFTGFVRDVTELRRAAERQREQATRAAALEQAKTRLLNLASHELRGPLGILNGYLAMIAEGTLGELPEDLDRIIPLLQSKVGEMNLLVDGMLDAARIDEDHLRLVTSALDLREVVERAVAQVAGMQRDRDRVSVTVPELPVTVIGDEVRLAQVVGNLVHNALKYSPGGGAVVASLCVEASSAVLRVEDHGLGIDAADMPRLFTRFGRIVNRRNSHIPGTGLGLYLAREIARMHGGDITVTSTPRAGSIFRFELPLALD
jgi:PAS domain S-box-containing protein